jgi:dihydrofolate reductase
VSDVIWHITMSLDGYIAGPGDSMDWAFAHSERSAVADDVLENAGSILGGRRWFDVASELYDGYDFIYGGAWDRPVLVLTNRPDEDPGDDRITFVPGPLGEALERAHDAAGSKNVVVFGAQVAQQCLAAGLLDEIVIHVAPVLLGDGVPLYAGSGAGRVDLERTVLAESGQLTDLRLRVKE